jgi:hypothetical protein
LRNSAQWETIENYLPVSQSKRKEKKRKEKKRKEKKRKKGPEASPPRHPQSFRFPKYIPRSFIAELLWASPDSH